MELLLTIITIMTLSLTLIAHILKVKNVEKQIDELKSSNAVLTSKINQMVEENELRNEEESAMVELFNDMYVDVMGEEYDPEELN